MGTAVHPYIMAAVFDPEATQALALAFDDICKHMNLAETAAHARETVATRIRRSRALPLDCANGAAPTRHKGG